MKLTRSVSYAVGILLRVAAGDPAAPLTATKIAKGCRFPPRYLYRVLRRLVDAKLLKGLSGPGGGYRLARSPERISLLEIVQAVEQGAEAEPLKAVHKSQKPAIEQINLVCQQQADNFNKALARIKLSALLEL